MKRIVMLVVAAGFCQYAAAQGAAPQRIDSTQKEKLGKILAALKVKASESRPAKHTVSLPVASAGARGADMRVASPFSVVWPAGAHISPLTALSENLDSGAAQGEAVTGLREQVQHFREAFPEFSAEPLLKDLETLFDDE